MLKVGQTSRPFPIQGSQAATGYVPSTSSTQFNIGGNLGQTMPSQLIRILKRHDAINDQNQTGHNDTNRLVQVGQSTHLGVCMGKSMEVTSGW